MNYLSTDDDRYVAAQGLKLVRKIMLDTETFKKMKLKSIDLDYIFKMMRSW